MKEFPLSPDDPLSSQELFDLVGGFIKLNQLSKVQVKEVTGEYIIVGIVKKINATAGTEAIKQLRKQLVNACKSIYQPFAGGRKVHVKVSVLQFPRQEE